MIERDEHTCLYYTDDRKSQSEQLFVFKLMRIRRFRGAINRLLKSSDGARGSFTVYNYKYNYTGRVGVTKLTDRVDCHSHW